MRKVKKGVGMFSLFACTFVLASVAKYTIFSNAENMELKIGGLNIQVDDNILAADVNSFLNVRLEPSTSSPVIAKLQPGDMVEYVEQVGEWTKVLLGDQMGYVWSAYTATGPNLKSYVEKNYKDIKFVAKQNSESYQTIYRTEEEAREDIVEYDVSATVKKKVPVYTIKSTAETVANEYVEEERVVVVGEGVRFRAKPSLKGTVYDSFVKSTVLELVSKKNPKWIKVKYNGKNGYVSKDYVKTAMIKVPKKNKMGTLTAGQVLSVKEVGKSWLEITYNGTSGYIKKKGIELQPLQIEENENVTGFLENNEECTIVEVQDDIVLVKLADGTDGYMKADNLKAEIKVSEVEVNKEVIATALQANTETINITDIGDVSEQRKSLVEYALTFVGNPYVWGGNSLTEGVDCSGFTQQIYLHFGISINRTSYEQVYNGTEIPLEQLQVGDLVFYFDTDLNRIGHVAIYIGDGQIVHAKSTNAGIVTSDMNYRTPYKAVKILN